MAITLHIRSMGGELRTVSATQEWTVMDVKYALWREAGLRPDLQRLIHGTTELRDAQLLFCLGVENGVADITLVQRPAECAEWLVKIQKNWTCLQDAPEMVKDDPVFVLAAVEQNGLAFELASDALRADPGFISTAVARNAGALAFASEEMRNNREFVLAMVRLNGCSLAGASSLLRGDRGIVMAAALENEYALMHAAQHLKNDPDFLIALAKKKVPNFLSFAGLALRNDKNVLNAIESSAGRGRH
mmetsp:Transcript_54541/g.152114  ORF Transcript_54541/g.152114 Transcript_54541/m.152114 type:complete len:246 (-) Transcript_54541:206-943(-)